MGKRRLELLLGAGGLILLLWMVHKIGVQNLKTHFLNFGIGSTLLVTFIYGLFQVFFCAAWHVTFKQNKRLNFWTLFIAYLAGDALNMTVPSANLAGEPVKVMLIQDHVGSENAVASVTVYKFADFVSMTLFLLAGWLFQFGFYSLPNAWNIGAGIIIAGMCGVCVLLYYLQRRGLYHPAAQWLQKFGLERWLVNKLKGAHLVDESIRRFYSHHPTKFILSIFFNFLAWTGGVVEIMLFMAILGWPVSFAAALTIEAFSMLINNIIFFVPARLGVGEGGRVLLFITLGYPASLGMSYGIVRRIRELLWISAGFIILLFKNRIKNPLPATSGNS